MIGGLADQSLMFEQPLNNIGAFSPPQTAPSHVGPAGIAAGNRVQTCRGEVAIEQLRPGETVVTACGRLARVVSRICSTTRTASVRIGPDAFGPMRPLRELRVAAGQRLLIDDEPATAATLVDGERITDEPEQPLRLVRVTLDAPGCLLIDGMAVVQDAGTTGGAAISPAA
jgi:hypothetical protein